MEEDALSIKTRDAVTAEIKGLIEENWDEIYAAFRKDYEEADDGTGNVKPFKFPLPVKAIIVPVGGELMVDAETTITRKKKHESKGVTVSMEPELPFTE